jgi:hypothetical protein
VACHGNTAEHCCWLDGVQCSYLREHVGGRRWACGLRHELGSWEAVLADERYQRNVQPVWDRAMNYSIRVTCANWPPPEARCMCDASR